MINQTTELTASTGVAYDNLGSSVAVSGDTVVVGADGACNGFGVAYVFTPPGGVWPATLSEIAGLVASDGTAGTSFGSSVSISANGNTVAVGAATAAVGANSDQGAAYVFTEPANGWSHPLPSNAKLLAAHGAAYDDFGSSVSVSADGSTVVVGADGWNAPMVGNSAVPGKAYVFTAPAGGWNGTANENAQLVASDSAAGDWFGQSVAIDGGTVVVGAPYATVGGNGSQGEAYVFSQPAGGWTGTVNEDSKLAASGGERATSSVILLRSMATPSWWGRRTLRSTATRAPPTCLLLRPRRTRR